MDIHGEFVRLQKKNRSKCENNNLYYCQRLAEDRQPLVR